MTYSTFRIALVTALTVFACIYSSSQEVARDPTEALADLSAQLTAGKVDRELTKFLDSSNIEEEAIGIISIFVQKRTEARDDEAIVAAYLTLKQLRAARYSVGLDTFMEGLNSENHRVRSISAGALALTPQIHAARVADGLADVIRRNASDTVFVGSALQTFWKVRGPHARRHFPLVSSFYLDSSGDGRIWRNAALAMLATQRIDESVSMFIAADGRRLHSAVQAVGQSGGQVNGVPIAENDEIMILIEMGLSSDSLRTRKDTVFVILVLFGNESALSSTKVMAKVPEVTELLNDYLAREPDPIVKEDLSELIGKFVEFFPR